MNWHRISSLLFLFFLLACAKTPGEIALSMDLTALIPSDQDKIQSFIILAADPVDETKDKVLYPQDCVQCPGGASSCAPAEACLSTTQCGFVARGTGRQSSFEVKIEFDSFDENEEVKIIVCAMDATQGIVGTGSDQVPNTGGESTSVALTAADECSGSFPPFCPAS